MNKQPLTDYQNHLKGRSQRISNTHIIGLSQYYEIILNTQFIQIIIKEFNRKNVYHFNLHTQKIALNGVEQNTPILEKFEALYRKIIQQAQSNPQHFKQELK
jgi:hypothetical protein